MFSSFNSVSNAGSNVFSMDCFLKSSYIVNSILNLIMPILILGFFSSIIMYKHKNNDIKCKRYLNLSSIVILISLHPTLVKLVLNFFQCTKSILGETYLLADVDIKCGSSEHIGLYLGLGIPSLIIYILGIPILAGMNMYTNRDQLNDSEIRERIGFLYADYESKYYLWELVIMLRLVCMAIIGVIFEGKSFYTYSYTYTFTHNIYILNIN